MTDLAVTDELFFERTGMNPGRVEAIVAQALAGMDDGELFLEYSQSESLSLDDGRIKSASFDTTQGFGLRAVAGEAAGYAHASDLSEAAIGRDIRVAQLMIERGLRPRVEALADITVRLKSLLVAKAA